VQLLQELPALDVHVRHPEGERQADRLDQRVRIEQERYGGHAIGWEVEAATEAAALAMLPFYVAERATATRVSEVDIP
jgi:hypothetical protein